MVPRCSPLTPSVFLLLIALAVATTLAPQVAHAQEKGTVAGVVVDSETGETLIGANVALLPADTTDAAPITGAATDLDGAYRIRIAPGTYDVRYTYIGYQPKTISGVDVTAGEVTNLEVSLAPDTAELEEVVVTVEAARDSEAGLLKERQKAAAVSDAISAETISRSGASDAAEAMSKVTGASVVDGKYVVVRGLGGRYSSTQLNGTSLPTADPDRQSVQFDLFPSRLLDNITTAKTFTPDKPGDFSGGLVDINTKAFPEAFSFNLSASASANPGVHFQNDFLSQPGGRWDWAGFGAEERAVPDVVDGTNSFPSPVEARRDPELAQRLDNLSDAFNDDMGPTSRLAPINQSVSASLGNQVDLLGRPFGFVVSGSYNRSASFYEGGETGRSSLVDGQGLAPEITFRDAQGTESASIGGILNMTYKVAKNHEIGFNNLYTHLGESESRFQQGRWEEQFPTVPTQVQNRTLVWTQRQLYSGQLRGKHYFPSLAASTIEWNASYATTRQEQPDVRFFANTFLAAEDNPNADEDSYSIFNPNLRPEPTRLFRDLTENRYSASLDYALPIDVGERRINLKAGGAYSQSDRDFTEIAYNFDLSSINSDTLGFRGDADQVFGPERSGIIGQEDDGDPIFGITVREASDPANRYTGDRSVAAGYLMAEVPVTDRFRVIAGARVEAFDLAINSRAADLTDERIADLEARIDPSDPDETLLNRLEAEREALSQQRADLQRTDVLPSVNLVYAVLDDMNVRLAATRTLARPTFREIAPFTNFDFILGNLRSGNTTLDRTLIDNLDARWEWFVRPREILAASVYFKRLQEPIERTIIDVNGQTTFINVDEAIVYGLELEARVGLDRLSERLQYLSVGVNASFTRSRIDIPPEELQQRREVAADQGLDSTDVSTTRELQGQSPYTVSADLGYENPESGTRVTATFSVFGKRLSQVTRATDPDVFELPRPDLNLTLSQRLFQNWSLKASAQNLLNSEYQEVYQIGNAQAPFQTYRLGRTFSLGVSYSI